MKSVLDSITLQQAVYIAHELTRRFPSGSSEKLIQSDLHTENILSTPLRKLEITAEEEIINELSFDAEILLSRLSFSHFIELLNAETLIKQSFYEVQVINNNWSVRELACAMYTLLYERIGLSTKQLIGN